MIIERAALQNNIAAAVMCNISPLWAFIMFCLLFVAINLSPFQGFLLCGFLENCFGYLLLYSNWLVIIRIPNQHQWAKMLIARPALQKNIASAVMYNISPLRGFIMFCLLFVAINLSPFQGFLLCGFLENCFG
ncbi:MAG: hypothetical protein JNM36_06000 [Chitinophagales bacterium]|nr:hypothetical protein [Chitinophagales bacterium]